MCGIVDREKLAAWRLVDGANTVAGEHPEPHPAARHTLSQARPSVLRAAEAIGCPRKTDGHGWETKVSEAPQDMVGAVLPLF